MLRVGFDAMTYPGSNPDIFSLLKSKKPGLFMSVYFIQLQETCRLVGQGNIIAFAIYDIYFKFSGQFANS